MPLEGVMDIQDEDSNSDYMEWKPHTQVCFPCDDGSSRTYPRFKSFCTTNKGYRGLRIFVRNWYLWAEMKVCRLIWVNFFSLSLIYSQGWVIVIFTLKWSIFLSLSNTYLVHFYYIQINMYVTFFYDTLLELFKLLTFCLIGVKND